MKLRTLYLFALIILSHTYLFSQIKFHKEVISANLYEVIQTSDSNYICVAWIGTGLDPQSAGLLKIDQGGNKIWASTYSDTVDVETLTIDTTLDKGYIIAGYSGTTTTEAEKFYIVKTDGKGVLKWSTRIGVEGTQEARTIHHTLDGGYIITGWTSDIGPNNLDIYVVKIDSIGNIKWSKKYDGGLHDVPYSSCQTYDGGTAILATVNAFTLYPDIYVIKIDSAGKTLWIKNYKDGQSKVGYSIKETKDKGLAIAGSDETGMHLTLTDSLGNVRWSRSIVGKEGVGGYSVSETSDNGFILAGNMLNKDDEKGSACAIKLDKNGKVKWTTSFDPTSNGVAFCAIGTMDGGFLLAGEGFELMKVDSVGNSTCNYFPRIAESILINSIAIDTSLQEFDIISSTYTRKVIVKPGVEIKDACIPNETVNLNTINLSIFPNPATSYFGIHTDELLNNSLVEIYDILGMKVYSGIINEKENINCESLGDGIYIVRVKINESFFSSKLVINRR